MKLGSEVSGYQESFVFRGFSGRFPLQNLLVGAFGLGVGLAGLYWSLRDGLLPLVNEQRAYSTDSSTIVPGLRNLGNNCFLNSILQALASCSSFLQFLQNLLNIDGSVNEQMFESMPLAVSLTSLLEELSLVRDERTVVNPREVMLALGCHVQGFNLTRQQDAAEAFIHLLSSLEKEIIESYIYLQRIDSLADVTSVSSRIYNPENAQVNIEKWQNHIFGPFDGIMGSYLSCRTCSSMLSVDLEFFRSLPLSPIPDRNADITCSLVKDCSLFDCLKHFTEVELVENYSCGRCWHTAALNYLCCQNDKDEVKISRLQNCVKFDSCDCRGLLSGDELPLNGISHALKKVCLTRAPMILCFHMQRASMNLHGEVIKLQGHISFPLLMDFSPFVETATNMGQFCSAKGGGGYLQAHDGSWVPQIRHLHKPQELQMLPNSFQIAGHKISPSPLTQSKFGILILGSKFSENAWEQNDNAITEGQIPSSSSSKSCKYNLCSVVEHYGVPGSGHYGVYRRMASAKYSQAWVYASDGEVKSVGEDDVLAAEASILFYEKMDA
ncbi:hypothetical protein HPP92_009083 [Vanilla planifolia]|uniref:Ubiquitin carboxyl-terminal hydrolase n=1 Tax=Vanilla planifolia TaxID=51239 RepID=A0A835RAU7_VANPL|nr:hypothetical protein HPP92_009083 [Vanilla planifolia]